MSGTLCTSTTGLGRGFLSEIPAEPVGRISLTHEDYPLALLRCNNRYHPMKRNAILACDGRGNTHLNSRGRTFTLGGFASLETNHDNLVDTWHRIKRKLCGSGSVELKWSHFFPGYHQDPTTNPLKSSDPKEWRSQALWALHEFFDNVSAFPITTIVPKDRIGKSFLTQTKKGTPVINTHLIFAATIGQFALYLKDHDLQNGEVWFDRLGSKAEEDRFQSNFNNLFEGLSSASIMIKNHEVVRRINPKIRFIYSDASPFIQIADFVSGVIWAASEGDTWFLRQLLDSYAPGRHRTYGIQVLIE